VSAVNLGIAAVVAAVVLGVAGVLGNGKAPLLHTSNR
jgi:hypothetical protein